ncbi:MAG TPA: D-glucuronyl C5-epimerase family protein [Kofleriaceae bacterium]|nr:D-glucuronyl C5-epimerase family protein [Kofleriaceae bacterium]
MRLPWTSARRIATDVAARFVGLVRQGEIARADPLIFDARIEHHGAVLGYYHLFTAESMKQTTDWLESAVYVAEAEKQHPIDACHLALSQFHAFLVTGDARARDGFLQRMRVLFDAGQEATLEGVDCFVMPHVDQVEDYEPHHKPHLNAMVQGWMGALLLRAHQLAPDDRYVAAARRVTGPFLVPVERGGVLGRLPHGAPFYEKYPFPGQTKHVLNGFLSSLFGLHDLARATGDERARSLFEQGIATLSDERTMRLFDNGYCTLYDLGGGRRTTPAGRFYTWVHARQLAGLSRITGSQELWRWAERWRDYVFKKRYRVQSRADTVRFRAARIPRYVKRTLGPRDE